jgi:hypothetical protein
MKVEGRAAPFGLRRRTEDWVVVSLSTTARLDEQPWITGSGLWNASLAACRRRSKPFLR